MTNCINQSVEEIVTEISMSTDCLPWLVLEGSSDNNFFVTKSLPRKPKPIVALGWENVVGVVAKVIEENITATVFGFIDRDYREELGIVIDQKRIVVSDFRDIEVSMFESSALHRVLVELGSENKLPVTDVGGVDLDFIKEKIYSTAALMGRIRYFSLKAKLHISFKDIDYSKFIDAHSLEVNFEKLLSQLNSKADAKISQDQINSAMKMELPEKLVDSKFLCSGHDVFEVLGIALRKLWGSNNTRDVSKKVLERHFRIGYSDNEFIETQMFKKLHALLSSEI